MDKLDTKSISPWIWVFLEESPHRYVAIVHTLIWVGSESYWRIAVMYQAPTHAKRGLEWTS